MFQEPELQCNVDLDFRAIQEGKASKTAPQAMNGSGARGRVHIALELRLLQGLEFAPPLTP